jgi:VanZ family protein
MRRLFIAACFLLHRFCCTDFTCISWSCTSGDIDRAALHGLLARTGFEPAAMAGSFFLTVLWLRFCQFHCHVVLKLAHLLLLTPAHARLRYWGAMALFALIVIIGSIPGARADAGEVASGVVLHSCAYAVLTFLVFTGSTGTPAQRAAKAVLTIAAMGFVDELVQSFLPYRHGAVSDWMVDCTAAVVTSSLLWALWTNRKVAT